MSSLDLQKGTAQVLIVDLETPATATDNQGIAQNSSAGGLHRALFGDVFAWADSSVVLGRVYQVR